MLVDETGRENNSSEREQRTQTPQTILELHQFHLNLAGLA